MLAVLPVFALATCVVACRTRLSCWREAVLAGAVVWGAALVFASEVLGALHLLAATPLAIGWLLIILCALVYLRRCGVRPVLSWTRPHAILLAFFVPLVVLIVALGVLTVSTAPNTWDSMTYHLARVIHWQQSASLAPYPTHILRQLYLQPGAELVLLHLQLLSGTDRFAGVVQWGSMVGTLIGISLVAEYLGARRFGVMCAVGVAASIPIGILEATSTQNDYVVTFWLVCMVVFGLSLLRADSSPLPWTAAVVFGAALGLALLTKATAYLFAFPCVIWVSVSVLRRLGWRAVRALTLAAILALTLNANFYARNVAVFGAPLGPPDEGSPALRYFNDGLTPGLFASNVIRDVGVNLVATPLVAVNVRSLNLVKTLHAYMTVDIHDPRTTWGGEAFVEQSVEHAFDENFAGNPLHVLLLIAAVAAVAFARKRLPATVPPYAIALVAGFVLFAAILRWQPWHTRLELPLFVLGAPLVGVVADTIAPRLALALASVLLVSMLPWIVNNQARPLVGASSVLRTNRIDQYFAYQPDLEQPYVAAMTELAERGCDRIGFISNQDGWEYPLAPLSLGTPRIEHVAVRNRSAGFGESFAPCAVLALGPAVSHVPLQIGEAIYVPTWSDRDVSILSS